MISEAVCVLGFSLLIAGENPKMERDTRYWIATNLCAAANDRRIDPQILGAYLLNENRKFDLWAVRPGVRGNDHGLFQINAYYQQDRAHLSEAHHPYYGAVIAASIIQDNLTTYGWSWKAFAAYWSPGQAQASTDAAKDYYRRFARHFEVVGHRFEQAEHALNTPNPPAVSLMPSGSTGGSPPLRASQRTNK